MPRKEGRGKRLTKEKNRHILESEYVVSISLYVSLYIVEQSCSFSPQIRSKIGSIFLQLCLLLIFLMFFALSLVLSWAALSRLKLFAQETKLEESMYLKNCLDKPRCAQILMVSNYWRNEIDDLVFTSVLLFHSFLCKDPRIYYTYYTCTYSANNQEI